MTLGEKLLAISNSEYLKFVSDMASYQIDASLALFVLDEIKLKLLDQIHQRDLEEMVKKELKEDK